MTDEAEFVSMKDDDGNLLFRLTIGDMKALQRIAQWVTAFREPTFFGTDSVGPQPNPVFRESVDGKIAHGKLKG